MSPGEFPIALQRQALKRTPLLAFNIVDVASARGVASAAERASVPVILQVSSRTVEFYGARVLRLLVDGLMEQTGARCFLHLDHCRQDAVLRAAIGAGFDGIMIDGSERPYSENVRLTRTWVRRAHRAGIVAEGAVSAIRGSEEGAASGRGDDRPDAARCIRFSEETEVDLIGTDIGTAHGVYAQPPRIDYALVRYVIDGTGAGFVVHGGSGLGKVALGRLSKLGVAKINISTDLKMSWSAAVRRSVVRGAVPEPVHALSDAAAAVEHMAASKILALGKTL